MRLDFLKHIAVGRGSVWRRWLLVGVCFEAAAGERERERVKAPRVGERYRRSGSSPLFHLLTPSLGPCTICSNLLFTAVD